MKSISGKKLKPLFTEKKAAMERLASAKRTLVSSQKSDASSFKDPDEVDSLMTDL